MKLRTKLLLCLVIVLGCVVWSVVSPASDWNAILALDASAIASLVATILMLLAAVLILIGLKKITCCLFTVILIAVAVLAVFSMVRPFTF